METGKCGNKRGSSIVESALVFNLFLLLVFGIMEFGRCIFAYNFVGFAAREGARYASVRGQNSGHPVQASDVQTFVRGEAVALTRSQVTVSTTWDPDNKPGSVVTVQVTYSYSPMLTLIIPHSLSLKGKSRMIISQ